MSGASASIGEKTQKLSMLTCNRGWSRQTLKRRLPKLKKVTMKIKNSCLPNDWQTNKDRVWLTLRTSVSMFSQKDGKLGKFLKQWYKKWLIAEKQCRISRPPKFWCLPKTHLSSQLFINSLEINSKTRSISRSSRKESPRSFMCGSCLPGIFPSKSKSKLFKSSLHVQL